MHSAPSLSSHVTSVGRRWIVRPRLRRALIAMAAGAVVAGAGLAATSSVHAAPADVKLGDTLGALWKQILEVPTPDSVFNGGDGCFDLGGTLAPVQLAADAPALTCTVKPGTSILVTAFSWECSNVEPPPFYGADEAELRACAAAVDATISAEVTVDGQPLGVREVQSGLMSADLPTENILGAPSGPALFVAQGWAGLVHPLTPGTHTITIHAEGTSFGSPVDFDNTATINVMPGL